MEIGRYDVHLMMGIVALAISYVGNRSIQLLLYDGGRYGVVLVARCSCTVRWRLFTILYLKRLQYGIASTTTTDVTVIIRRRLIQRLELGLISLLAAFYVHRMIEINSMLYQLVALYDTTEIVTGPCINTCTAFL